MIKIFLIGILLVYTFSFSTKLTMDTTSDKSIFSYYTDLGSCSCNVHPTLCDNFCCCDSICSASQISTWQSGSLCRNRGSSLQVFCEDLSSGSFYTFDDLACVYESNRGSIGYYYTLPVSILYPTASKLQVFSLNKSVFQYSASESINLASSTASTDDYSSTHDQLKMKKDSNLKLFEIWTSIGSGQCGIGFINITESTSFSCQYALSAQTCAQNTKHLQGTTIQVCNNGNCTTTTNFPPLSGATDNGGVSCDNMIISQNIVLTLSSSGSVYTIDTATITINTGNVNYAGNQRYPIGTTITINSPSTQLSGNPGYQKGKTVPLFNTGSSFQIYQIADSTTGNCLTTGTIQKNIEFGQNIIQSCESSNPCGSSLYIDSLISQTGLEIQKWGNSDSQKTTITGTSVTGNSCSNQIVKLDIIFSSAGWQLDKQFYIIGSQISTLNTSETTWTTKYLKINWIYVDPSQISTPPTNYFYQYFEYLWKPLRDYFGVY